MDKRVHKVLRGLKAATLTVAEREHMREALFAHMEQHPVQEDALVRRMLHGGSTFMPVKTQRTMPLMRLAPVLAMVVLLAAAGGVSHAAEDAVPGELLYAVKIHVNESVRSVMARGPEERIAWESERMERRLKEAQKLAARGELDEERSAQLSDSVTKQSLALALRIQDIEGSNHLAADEARMDAAIALETHDDVLSGIVAGTMGSGETGGVSNNDADTIIAAIRKTSESLAEVEETVDVAAAALPTEDSEEGIAPEEPPQDVIETAHLRYEKAENRIASARLLLSENRDALGELVALQARRALRTADEELHAGEADLELGLYIAATEHFTEALRRAKRADLLIEANLELSVEIDITDDDTTTEEGDTTEETTGESTTETTATTDSTTEEGGTTEEGSTTETGDETTDTTS